MLKPANGRTERYINVRLSTSPLHSQTYSPHSQYPANKAELVFLEESPDYCVPNPKQDIRGTSGRECGSEDQCYKLCCEKSWRVVHEWKTDPCHCKLNQFQ